MSTKENEPNLNIQPIGLSTFICSLQDPVDPVEQWRVKGGAEADGVALDPRIPPGTQTQWIKAFRSLHVPVLEVVHSLFTDSGYTAASFISQDMDELNMAVRQICASLELAHLGEVQRVVLLPQWMTLPKSQVCIVGDYAKGIVPPLHEELVLARANGRSNAVDAASRALDPVLRLADHFGIQLGMVTPGIFPHQFPDNVEAISLLQRFSGAPIDAVVPVDWVHARAALGLLDKPPPSSGSLWLADACGIETHLPVGQGEIDFKGWNLDADLNPAILILRQDVTYAEVSNSFKRIRCRDL